MRRRSNAFVKIPLSVEELVTMTDFGSFSIATLRTSRHSFTA